MHKKVLSILSFVTVFALFGIVLFCIFDGTEPVKADKKDKIIKTKVKEEKKTVYVDIKGAINNPGVYEVTSDTRIIDVIKLAGDLKEDADTSLLNLSKKVEDEMYIIIYTKEEVESHKESLNKTLAKEIEKEKTMCPDDKNEACINTNISTGKININTASKEELESLTGIGPSKAESIIEYRQQNNFSSVEDIKNVTGIGDSLFENIKDNIEV